MDTWKRYRWILSVSIGELRRNASRTILVIVTFAIGAMSLSSVFFISAGAMESITRSIHSLMGESIMILPRESLGVVNVSRVPSSQLSEMDLYYLRQHMQGVEYIAPIWRRFSVPLQTDSLLTKIFVEGLPDCVLREQVYEPVLGRSLLDGSGAASRSGLLQCMLNKRSAQHLLPDGWSQGKVLYLGNIPFEVIGVIDGEHGMNQQSIAVLPLESARKYFGKRGEISGILVKCSSGDDLEVCRNNLALLLDRYRGPGTYHLTMPIQQIEKRKQLVAAIMGFGVSLSILSFFIAAASIFNIMTADVQRRSKEFVIRIVCGADPDDVFLIIMFECVLLSLCGALVGAMMATLFSQVLVSGISWFAELEVPLRVTLSLPGFTVPMIVVLVFSTASGIIPASRTRRRDVVSVLKSE